MNLSLTSHIHTARNLRGAIDELKLLSPRHVRVSSLQKECLTPANIRIVKAVVDEGLSVIPVITSEKSATITDKEWRTYIVNVSNALPKRPKTQGWIVQIGNEWNTARFWGGQPDGLKAVERFKIATDIIRSRHDEVIILAPGVTNENKNGAGKMKARDFLQIFIDRDAKPDIYALHYYQTDRRLASLFNNNCKWLLANGERVAVTETGGNLDWYKSIAGKGFEYVPPGLIAWYCHIGHPGFDLTPVLKKEMLSA